MSSWTAFTLMTFLGIFMLGVMLVGVIVSGPFALWEKVTLLCFVVPFVALACYVPARGMFEP